MSKQVNLEEILKKELDLLPEELTTIKKDEPN